MSEYDTIRNIASAFARSPLQRNGIFECDAEIVEIGNQLWALTIDEFSPGEDLFTSDDPEALGANLATATISDLLAAGADPQWFMHAISLPRDCYPGFATGLASGISDVLARIGCSLCGGDLGQADTWRFCGFAMGPVRRSTPLTRVLPAEPQKLWVTGRLGDANLAAFTGSQTPSFELRSAEAVLIREIATACIDTSGGFMDSVWMLHQVSPKVRIEIDIARLPLDPALIELARAHGFPPEAALLGGAGEYELLFAAPESVDVPDHVATCVATAVSAAEPGVFIKRGGALISQMVDPPPCPREAATTRDHIDEVMAMAARLFGGRV